MIHNELSKELRKCILLFYVAFLDCFLKEILSPISFLITWKNMFHFVLFGMCRVVLFCVVVFFSLKRCLKSLNLPLGAIAIFNSHF